MSVSMCGRKICCYLLVLVSLLRTSTCLECYTCSSQLGISEVHNDCDYFYYSEQEHHKITQCLYTDSVCAKYIVDHSGLRWVHRSCQHHDICSVLSATYSNDMNMLLECETCADRNLCNSASVLVSSLCGTLILFVLGKALN